MKESKQQPKAQPSSEFTKKCRAMAEVVLESTEKLTEEKLTALLDSDWNGVGFIIRIFGNLLEGRLAAKEALEACDRLDTSEAEVKNFAEWRLGLEKQAKIDNAIVKDAKDRLDTSEASWKELLEALKKIEKIEDGCKERRIGHNLQTWAIAKAAIANAKKG